MKRVQVFPDSRQSPDSWLTKSILRVVCSVLMHGITPFSASNDALMQSSKDILPHVRQIQRSKYGPSAPCMTLITRKLLKVINVGSGTVLSVPILRIWSQVNVNSMLCMMGLTHSNPSLF